MRYLVITDDELVLKNIKLNNSCIILPAAENVTGEADFHETYSPASGMVIGTCPVCGRTLSAYKERISYCMGCGTKNAGVNNELG